MTISPRWYEANRGHDSAGGLGHRPTGRVGSVLGWVLAGVLAIASLAVVAKGVGIAWITTPEADARGGIGDYDMRCRAAEYRCFRLGIYPNRALAGPAAPKWLPNTPYPPYALPMFAVFFEPGGPLQGRLLIELLSLASIVVIGCHGFRELRFAGPAMAAVGGLTGAAIMGNSTALELGHFSIICAGLIVGQMVLLERGRPLLAGLCWTLAMIKPHIALAFAPLFLVDRQWRGLVMGCTIVGALGLFACWWTNVPPTRAVSRWFMGLSWVFATRGQGLGPGSLAAWLGISPQVVHSAMIVACGCLLAAVGGLLLLRRSAGGRGDTSRIAPLAGVCAVLGDVFIYHHHYDNVMLYPAAIAILTLAAAEPAWWSSGLAALMMATLWIPHRIITAVPFNGVGRAVIWLAVVAALLPFVVEGAAFCRLRAVWPARTPRA